MAAVNVTFTVNRIGCSVKRTHTCVGGDDKCHRNEQIQNNS